MRNGFHALPALTLCAAALASVGCSHFPGSPRPGPEVVRPDEVVDFPTLFKENCSGCHGENGRGGASLPLNNPAFLAVAGEDNLRMTVAMGEDGTLMPAFSRRFGGMLTDRQVDAIVQGLLHQWARPAEFAHTAPPPFSSDAPGNAADGAKAYAAACARCHGADGTGVNQAPGSSLKSIPKPGATIFSVVDPTYLALIDDQALRSIVIAGHPQADQPDWRSYIPGRPLTSQEINDIVAWLASHRTPAAPPAPDATQNDPPKVHGPRVSSPRVSSPAVPNKESK